MANACEMQSYVFKPIKQVLSYLYSQRQEVVSCALYYSPYHGGKHTTLSSTLYSAVPLAFYESSIVFSRMHASSINTTNG